MYVGDVGDEKRTYRDVFAHNFLIFNGFSIQKKFWKAETQGLSQAYHQILCIIKHVEDIRDKLSTPMGCNAMYVKDIKDRKKFFIYTGLFNHSIKS